MGHIGRRPWRILPFLHGTNEPHQISADPIYRLQIRCDLVDPNELLMRLLPIADQLAWVALPTPPTTAIEYIYIYLVRRWSYIT